MYEPRRVNQAPMATLDTVDAAVAAAFRSGPRRAAESKWATLGSRVAPTGLTLALAATAGAIVLNQRPADGADEITAVPARDDVASRADALRVEPQRAVQPTETVPAADAVAAPVAAQWSASFGSVTDTKYAQSKLTVRAQAADGATAIGEINAGDKVQITDIASGAWRQIVLDKRIGWVTDDQLGSKAPTAKAASGSSAAVASVNESVAQYAGGSVLGLKPKAMVVYNAVTSNFNVPSVGGWRSSSLSSHQCGLAIDFMVYGNKALGQQIADYVTARAGSFGVTHVIWYQQIWTPYRPAWRGMADRGGITANHMDHVHVALADHC